MNNNIVHLIGMVVSPFEFSHTIMGEDFYMLYVATRRTSGTYDVLPVMVSGRLIDITLNMMSKRVEVYGSWRSHNFQNASGGRSLKLFLFFETFQLSDKEDVNIITINGTICKPAILEEHHLEDELQTFVLL